MGIKETLETTQTWPCENVSAVCVDQKGNDFFSGDKNKPFYLASVTKPIVGYAIMIAISEGAIELSDQPDLPNPEGSTIEHLLSHASGMDANSTKILAPVGDQRIYSTITFEIIADYFSKKNSIPFAQYLDEAIFKPLGMNNSSLNGGAGSAITSNTLDMSKFLNEIIKPTLIDESLVENYCSIHFPALDGFLPGYGRQRPNPWGLGIEIRGNKTPHWMGPNFPPYAVGHFGISGTFIWVDRVKKIGSVVLTDNPFGSWTKPLWTEFNEQLYTELSN